MMRRASDRWLLLALGLALAATVLTACGGGDPEECDAHELRPPTANAPAPVLWECRP